VKEGVGVGVGVTVIVGEGVAVSVGVTVGSSSGAGPVSCAGPSGVPPDWVRSAKDVNCRATSVSTAFDRGVAVVKQAAVKSKPAGSAIRRRFFMTLLRRLVPFPGHQYNVQSVARQANNLENIVGCPIL
jgi:hypothetical protein